MNTQPTTNTNTPDAIDTYLPELHRGIRHLWSARPAELPGVRFKFCEGNVEYTVEIKGRTLDRPVTNGEWSRTVERFEQMIDDRCDRIEAKL